MIENPKTPEDRELFDWNLNHETAIRAHDRNSEMVMFFQKSAIDFGMIAIRSSVLIAGGSVVVGLAFISSVYADNSTLGTRLMLPVVVFAFAVILAGCATGFSYLSQFYFSMAAAERITDWKFPFIKDTDLSDGNRYWGNWWRICAVFCVVSTYILMVAGIISAWCILNY